MLLRDGGKKQLKMQTMEEAKWELIRRMKSEHVHRMRERVETDPKKMEMWEVCAEVAIPVQIDGDCTRVKHDPWLHIDYILHFQGMTTA